MTVPAIGQFYLILATLLFWVYDGHLIMFQMVVFSFTSLPIDGGWWDVSHYWTIAEFGLWIFSASSPVRCATKITDMKPQLSFAMKAA